METDEVQNKLVFVVKYWLPPLGWALFILILSSRPLQGFTPLFVHFDKLVHAGEYGILSLLLYRAFIHAQQGWLRKQAVSLSVLSCIIFGFSDEVHQMYVPMRTADAADFLADSIGVVLSHLGLWSVRSYRLKRKNEISLLFQGQEN